jgi:protein O-GlcNAc transferase
MAALRRDDLAAALAAYAGVLAASPDDVEALLNCAVIHGRSGNPDEAGRLLERVLALAPDQPVAHANVAKLALDGHDWKRAEAAARRAVTLAPAMASGHGNLAVALKKQGNWDEAAAIVEAGLARCPGDSALIMLEGELRQRVGDIDGAIAAYRRAAPTPANLSSLVAAHNYGAEPTREECFALHRAWAARFEPALGAVLPPAGPPAEGRLRVGYVSPDLRDHSVAFFIEPVLAGHDRAAVEVFCYASVARPDAVTARLARLADHWRDVASLGDEALARLIRRDRIDLLVDLAGHTLGNRLPVFAMRPAPVQANWIGYPNTTGLAAIDFRLTDAECDPPGAEAFHTERLVRLPGGFLCYRPPPDAPAAVTPPADRPFTFASYNAVAKIGPACIAAWSAILRQRRDARLRLKAVELDGAATRRRLLRAFAAHGVGAERLELRPLIASRREHLASYADVDLALDSFPYNGTTTTCEALWMGVPVLSLRGESHAGRVGASLLRQIGLEELIADDLDAYVATALALAGPDGRTRRQGWWTGLRAAMAARPLCRPALFVPALEQAYRAMADERRAAIGDAKFT